MSGTLPNPARAARESLSAEPAENGAAETAPRIAIVSRRLWPLAGEAERDVLRLATELQEQGARPTLVTARWQKEWSERTTLRGIPLTRLPWPATPGWGMLRYLYSLSRFLRQNQTQFDGVVVQGLRAEAYAALISLGAKGPPIVLRATEAGDYGEVAWQRQARFGGRIAAKCQQAEAIVAASSFVAAELQAANYSADKLHVFPPLASQEHLPRSEEERESARKALVNVNHDLHVVGGAPIAVCILPLQRDRGLENVVRSWIPIQQRWPHARLWILGDGPDREPLFRLICDLDLRYRVVIPGAFDYWEDLLAAADMLIAPAPQPSTSTVLREGLAAGMAVIASDQPEHRQLITPEKNGLLYATAERGSLSQCISRLIENEDLRKGLGDAAKASYARQETSESHWLRTWFATRRLRK
ncbi:glycosyltransferase family 4 protein [Anatilimnocola floriformis]|uniref:glycosyltransferase family 4 protein n=1 Tax=Anatilimnocola floriformis TaxID=2948575 RepID=UPI0020C4020E|nr:glycosyltransferase family 4 protein [Anatilimnocola floriformis]